MRTVRPTQMHHLRASAFADVPLQWLAEVEHKQAEQGRGQEVETPGQQIPHQSGRGYRHQGADLHLTAPTKRKKHSINAHEMKAQCVN